jgi:hypothetical protein
MEIFLSKLKKGKGCVDIEILLSELGIQPKLYVNSINFEATVTESSTGLTANSTSVANVVYKNFEVELIESNYYKPGFPIHFKV